MESPLFEVQTPFGWTVRTTAAYWQLIEHKHPEITGHLHEIKTCLEQPAMICRSKQDVNVFLFYCTWNGYHLCAVTKRLNDDEGFLITAYITDKIKEGELIWPTSV